MQAISDSEVNNLNILVIGDIMLDHYIYGDCNRISPEAPVPIVEVKSEDYTLGGAGNVVKNLKAFGCNVDIVSVVGDDYNAGIIKEKLFEYNILGKGLVTDPSQCTTIKTRVLVNNHQMIRLDTESVNLIDREIEQTIVNAIESVIKDYQLLLISDYNKGLLTPTLLNKLFELCRKYNIKSIVDPKGNSFSKYNGVNIIKPNKKEAIIATGMPITDKQSLLQVCSKIKEIANCDDVIITMSGEGIALFSSGKLIVIPTRAMDVVDVTGAGDTVLASLGMSIAIGSSLFDACDFANHAAAVVVSKVGSATATLNEIKSKFSG